ncbi:MAG: PfkB family carbohydrate kinase [Candidatus Woesearchaeota archaeon]|jgi:ribokinase|nr:PfkB family carbohydrate kinase [Candidatus Woesearchaeota archaeon]HJN57251.1 PfkB family carbohydrate kinase [Candidatus Woesearchaeota archaeon]|tara:strand:- start:2308 stop:3207 length:900 start_codon:yes stop_codon:yes gene_type:complete
MPEPIIIGTVALDFIETPFGKVENALGGSACYASIAASFFSKPGIMSIIGKDFPNEHIEFLKSRQINIDGITTGEKTFKWQGFYEFDMNEAKTLKTELNSLESYSVAVPESYKDAKYVFLANIDPEQQLKVINTLNNPELIVMDTMNFWIDIKKEQLLETIKKAHILILNDGEARQLFGTPNLVKAARMALKLVSKAVIIKKGEHGALLFTDSKHFNAPGYPLENIKDPTGCGDCFGGAFTGFLTKTNDVSEENMRKAVIYGSVVASLNAEGFSIENLKKINIKDIEKRYNEFKELRDF